jgi:GH25 family lysozyme M1 (1,4-beta-N-acetylmuramidase)
MTLNVIDVSRYQAGMNIGATGADAIIVGITYGSIGVNPYAADEISRARAAGKLVGLYHIRAGDGPTPAQEAQHFLDSAAQYLNGQTTIFLDWEECTLSNVPWALAWCDYIFSKTGIRPIMYMSASVSLAYNWASLITNYGLWVAQYPYDTVNGFIGVGWTPPATSWPALVGWQYAGTGGSVSGYTGLDLSVFYITAKQWVAYGTPKTAPTGDALSMATLDDVKAALRAILSENLSSAPSASVAGSLGWAIMNGRNHAADIHVLATANAPAVTAAKASADAAAAAVAGVPAAVLNQSFTTKSGVKTNVPGLLDAINTKPVGVVALSSDQVDQLAATLKAELPAATLAALATKLAS